MATVRGLGAVRVGDAIGEPPPGDDGDGPLPAAGARGRRLRRCEPERAGLAPRGPRPARRAGSAHRRPPGRPPPRDRGLALRRGPEGGHPGDARARLRHRRRLPRDDDGVHRAAGAASARPRRSSARRRKTNITGRSSPLSTNPFMATLGAPDRAGAARAPGSSSGTTSSRASSRSTCSRRPRRSRPRWRRTSARRWRRASPAGR